MLLDACGCLAGRGQIALVQLLGLHCLLVDGRGGRLAFEGVGFGLERAQLIRPR